MATKKNEKPVPFSFGLKINIGERKKERNMIKLECKDGIHNKFYNIEFLPKGNSSLTNFTVRCHYGKIGNAPQFKNHGFQTEADARKFMAKKLSQELKKGYKEI